MKFKNIYKETLENVQQSLMSLWAPGSHRMRSSLGELFDREPLMAEPVFQSIFPWKNTTDPNWKSYLDPDVINLQVSKAAARGEIYTPFEHQTESWKELKGGNSLVVTSGTGSGKTECFMLPVLSDLHARAAIPVSQTPVEAIFLYPLNALMQDQKDRLGKDCQNLGLRFSVYNGSLEDKKPLTPPNPAYPDAEVLTRENVRHEDTKRHAPSCPQILLTNPSMLEFMLVRDKDQEIFERSKGKLRWIVIDEAHTYTGSAAVELAYLIKRVLSAFDVSRDQVRFVCTSATIGDKSKPQELTDFIESIIGKYSPTSSNNLVHIDGDRVVSTLSANAVQAALNNAGLGKLNATDVLKLRNTINRKAMGLSSMIADLNAGPLQILESLEIIDKLCEAKVGKEPLLMLRGHFFMRTIQGLYACVNDHCSYHPEHVTGFSYLTTYRGDGFCPHCGAPLLEVLQCGDCKEFIVECEENDNHEIRSAFSNPDDVSVDSDPDDGPNVGNGSAAVDENWKLEYLAWYGIGRTYHKPHPDYTASRIALKWDGNMMKADSTSNDKPWVMLESKDVQYCPTCANSGGADGSRFNNFSLSANWLNGTIAPALMRESGDKYNEWGKYIAFTDSRQGTAINAKRFNIDAERAYARATLLEQLSTPKIPSNILSVLPALMQSTGKSQAECIKMLGGNPNQLPELTIGEVADVIFDRRIFDHIDYEASQRPFAKYRTDEQAYKTSLVRSIIGRRPVHLLNHESIGLSSLHYNTIDNERTLPSAWSRAGFTVQDWKDFLKICLDYVIRMGNHLQSASDEEKQYLRDSDKSMPFDPADWPSITKNNSGIAAKQSRLVLLLCAGLGINDRAQLQVNELLVDSLLAEAWSYLANNILKKVDSTDEYYNEIDEQGAHIYDGWYYLDMSLGSSVCTLKKTVSAWVCPVTNLVLDTVFKGYSPSMKGALCKENIDRFKITLPRINMPVPGSASFSADVMALEAIGLWNDRLKYAYLGSKEGYLTAEHSGQQNRDRLDHYTAEFKATPHRLNLLQCSTTMEMGVDIGDIDIVLMTNIPPSTANYMQRAGRAGRRGQCKAVSFSLCPNNAIGAQTFKDPMGIIAGVNPATKPVESDIVIQRHVNSFLVREFLCDPVNLGVTFSQIDPWLKSGGFYNNFVQWIISKKTDALLGKRFADVFGNGRSMPICADKCIIAIKEIADDYQLIISDIENSINNTKDQAKKNALSIQGEALMKMEPKGYLAEQQFLPNAAMPTGIVEFNHLDAYHYTILENKKRQLENLRQKLTQPGISQIQAIKVENEIIDCERAIKDILEKSVSSREIKVALSEYAPGQTIVIDERNYVSAGIEWKNSLNQKLPWKYLYHCPACGRYEYSADPALTQCPSCGGVYEGILHPANTHCTFAIEPIRFRTDVNRSINRKEKTERVFYDIKTILTEVKWDSSIKGPMCDLVGSDDSKGEIVFFNQGKGEGFNLCLECGKMEVHIKDRDATNWPHKDITEHGKDCPSSNPYNNILLSGRFPTTFVSLRFYKDFSGSSYEDDVELLYSLGVLLCRALAQHIGVSKDDLDFDVRSEGSYSSIFIYDTQKGGCGYATRLLDPVTCHAVFTSAKKMLSAFNCHCEDHVKGACIHCLIDRSSQRIEGELSKYKVMEWFNRNSMNYGNAPQGSVCVTTPLKYLLVKLYSMKSVSSITICVDARELNLGDWTDRNGTMGRILNECANHGKSVKLIVGYVPEISKKTPVDALLPYIDIDQKFRPWGIDVEAVESLETSSAKFSAVIVNGTDHYYTDQTGVLPFSDNWGTRCSSLYEDHQSPVFNSSRFPDWNDLQSLLEPDEIIRSLTINKPKVATVGTMLSNILVPSLFKGNDDDQIKTILHGKNIDIAFNDSYVNSALAGLILVYLIKSMKDRYGFNISKVELMFKSPTRDCHNLKWSYNSYIGFNFPDEQDADAYVQELFENVLSITPVFSQMKPDHHRWLLFQPKDEKGFVEIRPDHGISGGWISPERYIDADILDESTAIKTAMDTDIVYYLLIKKP